MAPAKVPGMNQKQRQEVFDRACRGILAQGRKSVIAGWAACAYRSENGAKCAVGHLITDEYYAEGLEGQAFFESCSVLEAVENSLGYLLYSWDMQFLQDLQYAHDFSDRLDFLSDFKERARTFAKQYKLSAKVLDQ